MYFGSFFSCIIGIGILILYYKLLIRSSANIFILVPLLASLYHLLYFFDWVMWFLQFFTFTLTSFTVYGFSILRLAFVKLIKEGPVVLSNAD